MPICTTCTHYVPYLYTVYQSANNLRLEQCPNCHNFADPYVEHDQHILLLDLILLKRSVFRHLLFNRGYEARKASVTTKPQGTETPPDEDRQACIQAAREKVRRWTILRLGAGVIFVDAFIRWSHLDHSELVGMHEATWDTAEPFFRILVGCTIETIAFHVGIALTCALLLEIIKFTQKPKQAVNAAPSLDSQTSTLPDSTRSGIISEFRLSHIPLTLLYSSLTKLFLLLLLTIWKPTSDPSPDCTPDQAQHAFFVQPIIRNALELLDEDKLDREWVVRNVLGGMAAGFGLRVVLDIHPVFTTAVVLVGWAVKTAVANVINAWVNRGQKIGEVFLAYSIP